jgi:hypothetical protein
VGRSEFAMGAHNPHRAWEPDGIAERLKSNLSH